MRTWDLQVFLLAWAIRIGNKVSVMIKETDRPCPVLIQFSSVAHSCLTLCDPMD